MASNSFYGNQPPAQGYPPQPEIGGQYPPNNGGGGYYDPNGHEKGYPAGTPGYDFSQQQAPPPHNAMMYQNGPGYNQQGPPQDQDRGAGAVAAGAGAGCCCACLAPILACCACCEILDCIF